ncbi:YopX family protein [Streptococcus ruminicola]|uniref:YopX family protein n=1 Tax=Streptococcus ruminicola TaxID=2686210 RepID=UPI003F613A6C
MVTVVKSVVFIESSASFGVEWTKSFSMSFDGLSEYYELINYFEVIGNIYENPELLGEEE